MRRVLRFLRVAIQRVSVALIVTQISIMVGVTAWESLRKKHRRLRRFPYAPATPVAVGQDEVTVYTFGDELYRDMLRAINEAQHTVHFETYIWKGDEVGEAFKEALGRAAARGVDVRVIWDEFANMVVPRSFFDMPCGVVALRHPPLAKPWAPRSWGRDHRKLLVVDRHIGFIGGYNIGKLYAKAWRDTHARIIGPSTAELDNAFVDFWNQNATRHRLPQLANDHQRRWLSKLRVHRNVPRIQVYPIRNMYLEAIDRATERIWLTHAYLIPDDDLVAALRDAVNRGVDVRIIVPARSNHAVADWLSRGFYGELLNSGIRLFLYQDAMVHSKTAVIDSTWCTIGTANLDRLSLWGNYEVNLEVTDPQVAAVMERAFTIDESNTVELTLDRWLRRPWYKKLAESLLSPWRPLF